MITEFNEMYVLIVDGMLVCGSDSIKELVEKGASQVLKKRDVEIAYLRKYKAVAYNELMLEAVMKDAHVNLRRGLSEREWDVIQEGFAKRALTRMFEEGLEESDCYEEEFLSCDVKVLRVKVGGFLAVLG